MSHTIYFPDETLSDAEDNRVNEFSQSDSSDENGSDSSDSKNSSDEEEVCTSDVDGKFCQCDECFFDYEVDEYLQDSDDDDIDYNPRTLSDNIGNKIFDFRKYCHLGVTAYSREKDVEKMNLSSAYLNDYSDFSESPNYFLLIVNCNYTLKTFIRLLSPSITHIILRNTRNAGFLEEIAERCPNLTHLSASGSKVLNRPLREIAKKCPKLLYLSIHHCKLINDKTLIEFANGCPNLTHLNLGLCTKLTDASIVQIADKCQNLKWFRFPECYKLTDTSLVHLVKKCTKLTFIDISFNKRLTDKVIFGIAENCPNIRVITAYQCKFTDEPFIQVAKNCPKVTKILLFNCPNVSNVLLMELANQCVNFIEVDLGYEGKNITRKNISKELITHIRKFRKYFIGNTN